MTLRFRVGNCAFQMDRERPHAKFRVLREFVAHQRYTRWTLAGAGSTQPGALRNFPQRNLPPRIGLGAKMSALYTVYILARNFTTAPHPPDRPAQIMSSEPRSRNSFGHRNKTVQSSLEKPFAGHGGGAGGGGDSLVLDANYPPN